MSQATRVYVIRLPHSCQVGGLTALFITRDLLLLPVPHMRFFFVYGFTGAESRKQKGVLIDLLYSEGPPLKHRVALRMSVARVAGLTAQPNTARGPRPA